MMLDKAVQFFHGNTQFTHAGLQDAARERQPQRVAARCAVQKNKCCGNKIANSQTTSKSADPRSLTRVSWTCEAWAKFLHTHFVSFPSAHFSTKESNLMFFWVFPPLGRQTCLKSKTHIMATSGGCGPRAAKSPRPFGRAEIEVPRPPLRCDGAPGLNPKCADMQIGPQDPDSRLLSRCQMVLLYFAWRSCSDFWFLMFFRYAGVFYCKSQDG